MHPHLLQYSDAKYILINSKRLLRFKHITRHPSESTSTWWDSAGGGCELSILTVFPSTQAQPAVTGNQSQQPLQKPGASHSGFPFGNFLRLIQLSHTQLTASNRHVNFTQVSEGRARVKIVGPVANQGPGHGFVLFGIYVLVQLALQRDLDLRCMALNLAWQEELESVATLHSG
jgi:hypothetical protein